VIAASRDRGKTPVSFCTPRLSTGMSFMAVAKRISIALCPVSSPVRRRGERGSGPSQRES